MDSDDRQNNEHPSDAALISVVDGAWRDHHHARDQTWKVLQIEAVLGAGLVTVDAQFQIPIATVIAAALVIVSAIIGIMVTLRHRDVERRIFVHIMNSEEALGLHRDDIIPLTPKGTYELGLDPESYKKRTKHRPREDIVEAGAVEIPGKIDFYGVFRLFSKNNTSLFIMRMHFAIAMFSLLLMAARFIKHYGLNL